MASTKAIFFFSEPRGFRFCISLRKADQYKSKHGAMAMTLDLQTQRSYSAFLNLGVSICEMALI